ncbi:hypothetical protein CC78DRAFT_575524 [Lojkania enalia]|uniref:Uncharacterized protein n=1 Tax=Lojkania enalia TaxID=147567 RepID=A0A9P4N9A2_9PLEO|nr:hypothetical protein CC78DRAFT_575524 [Didymosphaeria enalia]
MPNTISCVETSVQPGSLRFGDTAPEERPKLKEWRCDLTALSRVYNLYFVAYSDIIHVYQPSFPDQRLLDRPALTLHPPVSSPDLDYVLDPECPHSINRLHLDFLGRDEILLAACDDGDVIGYSVPQIQRVIENRSLAKEDKNSSHENRVRVFLHRNVGQSVWGLAIHREARLIAMSANTHKVTVIAYALANPPAGSSNSAESISDGPINSSDDSENDFPHPRRKDHILTLTANHNIPTVSFDNNGTDPGGRWLYSSSIGGKTHLWDLHNPQKAARTLQMGRCSSVTDPNKCPTALCRCRDRARLPHAAWNALFIDPRSCRKSYSHEEAFGIVPTERAPCFWDISESKSKSWRPSSDETHFDQANEEDEGMSLDTDEEEYQEEHEESMSTIQDDHEPSEHSDQEELEPQPPPSPQTLFVPEHEPTESSEDDTSLNGNEALVIQLPTEDLINDLMAIVPEDSEDEELSAPSPVLNLAAGAASAIWIDALDALPVDDQILRFVGKTSYCEIKADTNQDEVYSHDPTIIPPTVIVTKQDIHLVQPQILSSLTLKHSPIVFCKFPHLPYPEEMVPGHDRLCYSTQIPELGLLIAASPANRIVLLSLTQILADTNGPPTQDSLNPRSKLRKDGEGGQQIVYGFKLEKVLPDDSITAYLATTNTRIVGVAVGPVQGMFDISADEADAGNRDGDVDMDGSRGEDKERDRTRRWRMIVMFTDHTVLAYELARTSEEVAVADLVV